MSEARRQLVPEPWVLIAAAALTGLGLVMVYSASSVLAAKRYMDGAWYFKRQLLNLVPAVGVMVVLWAVDYRRLEKAVYPLVGLSLAALIMVFIPGVGRCAGGACRWIAIGPMRLQPAELAKVVLVIYLGWWLASHQQQLKSFSLGLVPPLGVSALLAMPVVAQPDLGMAVMLLAIAWVMMFVAGVRVRYLLGLVGAMVPVVWGLVVLFPYRAARIVAFLDPWGHRKGVGYQIVHSFLALGSGGWFGTGLGSSRQKLFYLPEPHTDFIMSVLGEELGLVGVVGVLVCFAVIVWRGVRVALEARELMGSYLALGAAVVIGLQAVVNAAVVMGLLPTKGLTLPFISYGGSSLVANFACVGLIMSVAARGGGG